MDVPEGFQHRTFHSDSRIVLSYIPALPGTMGVNRA